MRGCKTFILMHLLVRQVRIHWISMVGRLVSIGLRWVEWIHPRLLHLSLSRRWVVLIHLDDLLKPSYMLV